MRTVLLSSVYLYYIYFTTDPWISKIAFIYVPLVNLFWVQLTFENNYISILSYNQVDVQDAQWHLEVRTNVKIKRINVFVLSVGISEFIERGRQKKVPMRDQTEQKEMSTGASANKRRARAGKFPLGWDLVYR